MRYLDRITNPDDTPLAWLAAALADAIHFHAHVGYLDRAGIRLIEAPLKDLLDRGGAVSLIADYRDGLPRYGDIASIVELLAPYGDRAALWLMRDVAPMHAKVFTIKRADGGRRALVGSANLTAAGLGRNWEACVALSDETDAPAVEAVFAAADAWRRHKAGLPVTLGDLATLAKLDKNNPSGTSEVFVNLLEPTLNLVEGVASGTSGAGNGIPTGFTDLDRLLAGGLHPGQLVLVAGRTGIGKSTLATDILRSASVRHNTPGLLLSFEMPKLDVMMRLLSAESRVPLHVLRTGLLTDDDWTKLARRMGELVETPIHINDSCSPTIRHVAAEIRRAVRDDGVGLVVVDYVQQVAADRRVENRQQEVSEVSRALKRLALELQVPIVAVAQLNRMPDMRTDKRPQLSDLRESGSLEQEADVVMLLHRDDYYDKESPRAGEADFIVAKHRNGPTDTVTVAAQLHLSRFVDMAVVP